MLITSADLKTQTKNDLAQMAKRLGVSNWSTLSKDQLVAAIVKRKKSASKPAKASAGKSKGDTKKSAKSAGKAAPGTKSASRMTAKVAKVASKSDTKKPAKPSKAAASPVGKVAKTAKVPVTINGKSAHGKSNGSTAPAPTKSASPLKTIRRKPHLPRANRIGNCQTVDCQTGCQGDRTKENG